MQRLIRLSFIGVILALPEATSATPNVPIRSVVDERNHRTESIRDIVLIHKLSDMVGQLMHPRDYPAVKRVG